MKNISIYDKTAAYATEHNELETYRASYKANMTCKDALTEAIHSNYKDNKLGSEAILGVVTDTFSLERVAVITAVSIRELEHDGRVSRENKDWAKNVPFPKDIDDWGRDRNDVFRLTSVHPGLLNLFADTLRKELERTNTVPLKKPSLVEKLNRPLPQKSDKTVKSMDKGR